jgi:hypothetical protein
VLKIDSVLVGISYHKRFVLGFKYYQQPQNDTLAIIEGIGSTYGLFNMMMPPFESGTNLICYNSGNQTYPANSNCNMILGLNIPQELTTSIYPNPTNSKFTIETEKSFSNANLILTNCFGSIVFQMNHISGQTLTIDGGNLTIGVYYLRVQDGSNEYVGKVIISDK